MKRERRRRHRTPGPWPGSDAVFDAAIRRAGVLRVTTIPDLFNMAEILAHQPPPRGPNLAIITNAGGPGVMATDALMLGGGQLAPLSQASLDALSKVLPPFWSHGNPIDVLGDATPAALSGRPSRFAPRIRTCRACWFC